MHNIRNIYVSYTQFHLKESRLTVRSWRMETHLVALSFVSNFGPRVVRAGTHPDTIGPVGGDSFNGSIMYIYIYIHSGYGPPYPLSVGQALPW